MATLGLGCEQSLRRGSESAGRPFCIGSTPRGVLASSVRPNLTGSQRLAIRCITAFCDQQARGIKGMRVAISVVSGMAAMLLSAVAVATDHAWPGPVQAEPSPPPTSPCSPKPSGPQDVCPPRL